MKKTKQLKQFKRDIDTAATSMESFAMYYFDQSKYFMNVHTKAKLLSEARAHAINAQWLRDILSCYR